MKKLGDNKRGQVTIFIIVAIVIIALGILIYMFYPQVKSILGFEPETPSAFIQICLEEEIENTVEKLSLQGGSINPEHYIVYDNEKIEYLCYTNKNVGEVANPTCVMQQAMLKEHIESEIENDIEVEVEDCFDDLEESYKKQGYSVDLRKGGTGIELAPKRIVATFDNSLTLTKEGSETYGPFRVVVDNNLYELVSITNSILNWEARYGKAESTVYMNYYHDLKVEPKLQSDGTTVYILTDRNTGNKFQFASRSVAWPPGYGL